MIHFALVLCTLLGALAVIYGTIVAVGVRQWRPAGVATVSVGLLLLSPAVVMAFRAAYAVSGCE